LPERTSVEWSSSRAHISSNDEQNSNAPKPDDASGSDPPFEERVRVRIGDRRYLQYRSMISRAHSGSLTSPRGRKPAITGLMSKTGVPSMASRP
jgi:hypothetical protein